MQPKSCVDKLLRVISQRLRSAVLCVEFVRGLHRALQGDIRFAIRLFPNLISAKFDVDITSKTAGRPVFV